MLPGTTSPVKRVTRPLMLVTATENLTTEYS